MPAELKSRNRALVFGGSGSVGAEVVRGLALAGVSTVFTYHRGRERALGLEGEFSRALPLDLRDSAGTRAALRGLAGEGGPPNVFIHCAAVSRAASLAELTDELQHLVNQPEFHAALPQLKPFVSPGR